MKLILSILALAVGATNAYITSSSLERSESLPFLLRPQNLKGYVGDVGFDPFGFSEIVKVDFLREAELKHGRLATMAWCGWIAVDKGLKVYPAPAEWADLHSLDAYKLLAPSSAMGGHTSISDWDNTIWTVIAIIAGIECLQAQPTQDMFNGDLEPSRAAGDLDFDILCFLKGKSPEEVERMKLRELKNVRLGMLAFAGVFMQSTVMGHTDFPYF